eukprot:s2423_g15.t1
MVCSINAWDSCSGKRHHALLDKAVAFSASAEVLHGREKVTLAIRYSGSRTFCEALVTFSPRFDPGI